MATVRDASGNAPFSTPDRRITSIEGIAKSYAVSPSDSVDLPNGVTTGILVDTAGAVKVTYKDGTVSEVYLIAGQWHLMEVTRIWATTVGTIAQGIEAGYA